ncbi:peptide-methionine (S)-S-oxide reductase MsrA [Maricaulis parjimensis]|uniref:peptide-methionine (S)-S-oxide reductase MsrA n=1 Tax=Maricaulis parjimensis TaxID=144023 RepID=UPI00193AA582|nr:peptide-methionine (S)-S-oxide reductase MsrA [Maricaulis parjimensis]
MTPTDPNSTLITTGQALPGRDTPLPTADTHFVTGRDLKIAAPDGMDEIIFGMGCFWGVERLFWQTQGVWHTAVGYAGGISPNPTYEEVCSGQTGHAEVVRVIYDPSVIALDDILKVFWEGHDPTQGMRQGNDLGTQYRSAIYTTTADQAELAHQSRATYQAELDKVGMGPITTQIERAGDFYYAEDYHQQYLAKNPDGYCGLGGTGVVCPIGLGVGA